MIQIKPQIEHQSNCPYNGKPLKPENILWQGMHVCVKSKCPECHTEFIEDLKIGHAINHPYQVDLAKGVFFGDESSQEWLGKPLLKSLQNPHKEEIEITKEVFREHQRVIILNCIDFLYGHSLLKLLNAQRYLDNNPDYGLVVIVPKFLRWMVTKGVAEVWTVNIYLKNGQCYYSCFDKFVREESKRFEEIYVSDAYSHPSKFDISRFTGVAKHNFQPEKLQITFIWRQDRSRLWCNALGIKVLNKLNMLDLALYVQNRNVQRLFEKIRARIPSAKFAIAGLGKKTQFPAWIEDLRVDKYDEKTEREACKIYADSRLAIGVHGSHMLLPSGHAGMTIDLIGGRWGNFAQDILYQETDPRIAAFRYRYISLYTSIPELAEIACSAIEKYNIYSAMMTADKYL
ncbi:hypothetical protein [Argonema galeatum]|uniref:hypothetical protein n=1 Tax=Argonema galeatum TaxID=2942762 RepID=UPI00201315DA|nr:hypothetical protein [Argonema galeatum]MCL1467691.1 hypothetical protein [Argonema galeatum A003/A1]